MKELDLADLSPDQLAQIVLDMVKRIRPEALRTQKREYAIEFFHAVADRLEDGV